MTKDIESTLELLERVNQFLLNWNQKEVIYKKNTDYFCERHDIFYIRRDVINAITISLSKAKYLLKEAKKFNYQKSPIQTQFLFESQFQLNFNFFLLENGFDKSELPDLSTTYINVITYLKRAKRQQDVILVCKEAIHSDACAKYMDYSKEIVLAKSRLNKKQKQV